MPTEELPAHLRHAQALNRGRIKDYLLGIEERIRGPRHVRTTVEVIDGEPVDGLHAAALEHDVDLVVMTSHGRGGFRRAWLGSVADQLIRRCDRPVMLLKPASEDDVDPRARRDFATILVPLDGSAAAEAALAPALALARLQPAPITLLRVVSTPVSVLSGPVPYGVVDHVALVHRQEAAEKYLNELAERLREDEVEVSTAVLHDEPLADAIIDYAKSADALIVIATHGRGGLKRLVLGSVADKVIRGAAGPVVAVHPAQSAQQPSFAAEADEWSGVALLAASGAVGDARASHDDSVGD
jgi:nucleotide-binding universal stress UspA family protein